MNYAFDDTRQFFIAIKDNKKLELYEPREIRQARQAREIRELRQPNQLRKLRIRRKPRPVNYNEGKIYKITNDVNNLIYIGSTCKPLIRRFNGHRKEAINFNSSTVFHKAIREIGIKHFFIELIKECPTNNQESLLNHEGYYIHKFDSTNPEIGYNMKNEGIYQIFDYKIDINNKILFKPYKFEIHNFDINKNI